MTIQQVEEKVIELIHRQPFVPFVVEMTDGQTLEVPHPRLAIDHTGAGFIGPEGGLVDIEFAAVRAIRVAGGMMAVAHAGRSQMWIEGVSLHRIAPNPGPSPG